MDLVLAGTADRRFRYGDYDFGVIAKLHAHGKGFMQQITFRAA
jgi:hypothetical protein